MTRYPRVAVFTDGFEESDDDARISTELDKFAKLHALPFLTIQSGSHDILERRCESRYMWLERSRFRLGLKGDFHFDPFLFRHYSRMRRVLDDFRPDLIHVTGPGDAGLLGLYLSRALAVPMVASWPAGITGSFTGRGSHYLLRQFYRRAQVVLAPTEEMVQTLRRLIDRPAYLMRRGIDTSMFSSSKRLYADGICRIGFAGRLSPDKNVRFLVELDQALRRKVTRPFRFLIVGDGSERPWLEACLRNADFTGPLQGEALARAYARMDIFAFPSETETFGSPVLQAMASGAPAVVMSRGGARFLIAHGVSGFVSTGPDDFIRFVVSLLTNRELRRRMAFESCVQSRRWSWAGICESVYRAYRFALRSAPPLTPTKLSTPPPSPCPAI